MEAFKRLLILLGQIFEIGCYPCRETKSYTLADAPDHFQLRRP